MKRELLTVIPTEHGCSTCYPERGCVAQPLPTQGLAPWHGRAEPARPQLWCGRGWQGSGSGGLTPRILGLAPCQGQFLWKGLSRNFWGLCVFARLTEELEDDLASRDHHRRLELSVI